MIRKENPYHIEIIGKTIGHANVISIEYVPILNLDLSKGNIFEIILNGDLTLNIDKSMGGRFMIVFKQDNIGGHVITFGNHFMFTDSDPGSIPSLPNAVSIVDLLVDPEGPVFYCTVSPDYKSITTEESEIGLHIASAEVKNTAQDQLYVEFSEEFDIEEFMSLNLSISTDGAALDFGEDVSNEGDLIYAFELDREIVAGEVLTLSYTFDEELPVEEWTELAITNNVE